MSSTGGDLTLASDLQMGGRAILQPKLSGDLLLNGKKIIGQTLFLSAFVEEKQSYDQNVLRVVKINGSIQVVALNNFHFKRFHIIQNAEAGTLVFQNSPENNPRTTMLFRPTIRQTSTVTTVEVDRRLHRGFFYIDYSHPNSKSFDLSLLVEFVIN